MEKSEEEILKEEKDLEIYKRRLLRGESEKSARSGLSSFEEIYIDSEVNTNNIFRDVRWPPVKTSEKCYTCNGVLYDNKRDGKHLHCPNCKKQINILFSEKYAKKKEVKPEVGAYPDRVFRWKSKNVSSYKCPSCSHELYDTKMDGKFYYCPKCKMQHNEKFIS